MNVLSILAVVACVAVSVAGHAVVVSPTPFNTNPSKTFGCGGASGGPLNVIPTGGTVNWKLIAGDGAGDIRMLIDPAGGSGGAFPQSYQAAPSASIISVPLTGGTTPTVVGQTYSFDFTLPAGLTCSPNAPCTAQISSTSNWVSCFSFSKTAPTTTSGSTGSTQQQAQGNCVTIQASSPLTTCTMLTGKTVWVPLGSNVNDLDAGVQATLVQNLPNERVFWAQPQSADVATPCSTAYRDYLCAQAFVPCGTTNTGASTNQPTTTIYGQQPCGSVCREFTCWCDLNDLHAFLYDCTQISNANKDSVGVCNNRKYGPPASGVPNATATACIPRTTTSTAGTCPGGECGAAPHTASQSTFALAAVVATVAAVLYAHNH